MELRREGLARDVVRVVQDARKAAGLDVSDRIVLGIGAMGEVAEAMRDEGNRSRVAEETLATVLNDEPLLNATYSTEADLAGDAVTVTLRRA
jgi:isoleucyl-tRNA synthetase